MRFYGEFMAHAYRISKGPDVGAIVHTVEALSAIAREHRGTSPRMPHRGRQIGGSPDAGTEHSVALGVVRLRSLGAGPRIGWGHRFAADPHHA